jgi:predicted RNA binding protein YcfA (HicA-like mRNA interferase family)
MKPMKYRELVKLFEAHGCTHVGTVGSHEKWRTPRGLTTSVPRDSEIAPGTLRNIRDHLASELGEGWLR